MMHFFVMDELVYVGVPAMCMRVGDELICDGRVRWMDAVAECLKSGDVRTRSIGIIGQMRMETINLTCEMMMQWRTALEADASYWGSHFWSGCSLGTYGTYADIRRIIRGIEMRGPEACAGMWAVLVTHMHKWDMVSVMVAWQDCGLDDLYRRILHLGKDDATWWVWVARDRYAHMAFSGTSRVLQLCDGRCFMPLDMLREALQLDRDCAHAYLSIVICSGHNWTTVTAAGDCARFRGVGWVGARAVCERVVDHTGLDVYTGCDTLDDQAYARGVLSKLNFAENVVWRRVAHVREWKDWDEGDVTEAMFGALMMGLARLRESGPDGPVLDPAVGWHDSVWEGVLEDGGWRWRDSMGLHL